MMDELTLPLTSGWEEDVLTSARKWYRFGPGVTRCVKRAYRKRCRQADKRRVEQMAVEP